MRAALSGRRARFPRPSCRRAGRAPVSEPYRHTETPPLALASLGRHASQCRSGSRATKTRCLSDCPLRHFACLKPPVRPWPTPAVSHQSTPGARNSPSFCYSFRVAVIHCGSSLVHRNRAIALLMFSARARITSASAPFATLSSLSTFFNSASSLWMWASHTRGMSPAYDVSGVEFGCVNLPMRSTGAPHAAACDSAARAFPCRS